MPFLGKTEMFIIILTRTAENLCVRIKNLFINAWFRHSNFIIIMDIRCEITDDNELFLLTFRPSSKGNYALINLMRVNPSKSFRFMIKLIQCRLTFKQAMYSFDIIEHSFM